MPRPSTRARAASPADVGASLEDEAMELPSVPSTALATEPASTSASASVRDTASQGAAATTPHAPQWDASPAPPPPTGIAAQQVVLTTDQLMLLIDRISRNNTGTQSSSFTGHVSTGHFAKCTARFDGNKSSDVRAFIDAVETYKMCVGVEDSIALRGLPMLLTGLAATWWQGVKDTTLTWQAALEALQQTFGPRLPPHKIYRLIFEREQKIDEATDLFVCHIRSLMAQLPSFTLTECVQLDMTYGLLHRRIREKVPRSAFDTFSELLVQARRVEDILDEQRPRVSVDTKPPTSSAVVARSVAERPESNVATKSRSRPQCNYCKQYGHVKEACQRLAKQKSSKDTTLEVEPRTSTVTCFGCGAPGFIRANCPTCKQKRTVEKPESAFQSVSASAINVDSRVRPVLSIEICGTTGNVLVDTGAKHSIGSISLRALLVKNNHVFKNVFTEIKYADGRVCAQHVEVANVNVTVRGRTCVVDFIMLPNATDSLLGMNFINDIGMVLDFDRNVWFVRYDRTPQPIKYEFRCMPRVSCSSVGLREDEGSHLVSDERQRLSELLSIHEDIFAPGENQLRLRYIV